MAKEIIASIDYLIHAYKIGTEPFRTLSALPEAEALGIMSDLYMKGSIFWERFENPMQYLQLRRQVEEWLQRDFIAKGGKPRSSYPIYMMLGRSRWVQTLLDGPTRATTVEIEVPLCIFNEWEVSFTYPDSMVSFIENYQKNEESYLPEYHGKVFTLCEIRSIVEANGLPGERWGMKLSSDLPNYIEAQVWNHEPLLAYKRRAS
jgi:hypothetical protein